MKKVMIISSLFIAAIMIAIAATGLIKREAPVNKEINLAFTSHNNYSSAAYSDAKASVHVVITKVNGKKQTIVMDKVYEAMQLQDVPTNGNAINNKVVIPNVFNGKEKLVVTYTISYDSDGSIIRFCNDKVASEKSNHENIQINI